MNDLKKVLLAGIGLTAMTVEQANDFFRLIHEMVDFNISDSLLSILDLQIGVLKDHAI